MTASSRGSKPVTLGVGSVDLTSTTLRAQETIIENGLSMFVEVGYALMRIRDEELYREGGFDGFEDYLQSKPWALSRSRSYQLIDAARISTIVDTNEGQARELVPLLRKATPDVVRQVYAEVVQETNGKTTAAAIREKVQELLPPRQRPALRRPLTVDLRPEGLLETATAVEELVRALVLIRGNGAHPEHVASTIEKLEWVSEEIGETLRVLKERSTQ